VFSSIHLVILSVGWYRFCRLNYKPRSWYRRWRLIANVVAGLMLSFVTLIEGINDDEEVCVKAAENQSNENVFSSKGNHAEEADDRDNQTDDHLRPHMDMVTLEKAKIVSEKLIVSSSNSRFSPLGCTKMLWQQIQG
jgi:hypothetical protein